MHTKCAVSESLETLYSSVENMCIHKRAAKLYTLLHNECSEHISNHVKKLVAQTPNHAAFLEMLDSTWQDHQESVLTIRNIFLYLDRTYVISTPAVCSIWDMVSKLDYWVVLSCFHL